MSDVGKVAPVDGIKKEKLHAASVYDVFWLGLTIVIGGQITSWNIGLAQGFWIYLIAFLLISTGYLCLCFCIAEMTSFLAFAGGSYGYVRCAMGPTAGYLVGFCESIEYILYVSASVVVFGDLFPLFGAPADYAPLYWMIFYAIALLTIIPGGAVFWQFSNLQAIICLLLILLYCFAGMSAVDLDEYVPTSTRSSSSAGGGSDFMLYLPLAAWFYVGVEAMTLTCEDIKDAGKQVPWAIMACVSTLFVTGTLIYFISSSLSPGPLGLSEEGFPLDPGYQAILGAGKVTVAFLALPGIFSTAYGFMFAYGRQLYSMSKSGLFPRFLSHTYGKYDTPYSALLVGSAISYVILLVLYYTVPLFGGKIFNICMLGSCSVYISLARAYVVCHDRYSNLQREFTSPLGKWAAYWVMAVFSLMMVGLAFFQDDGYLAITVFVVFIIAGYLYYHLIAHKREFFSEEEQQKFMKAYILNANHNRKHKAMSFAGSLFSLFSGKRRPVKVAGHAAAISNQQQGRSQVSHVPGHSVIYKSIAEDIVLPMVRHDSTETAVGPPNAAEASKEDDDDEDATLMTCRMMPNRSQPIVPAAVEEMELSEEVRPAEVV